MRHLQIESRLLTCAARNSRRQRFFELLRRGQVSRNTASEHDTYPLLHFSPPPPSPVHTGIIPRRRPSVLPGCCTIAESSCNDVPAVRSRKRRGGTIRATKRSASPPGPKKTKKRTGRRPRINASETEIRRR